VVWLKLGEFLLIPIGLISANGRGMAEPGILFGDAELLDFVILIG